MNLLPADSYPVPFSETWRQLDSTKLKQFMSCPRSYFYQYVLGWRLETMGESLHLIFGQAWHLAMEHLLKQLGQTGQYDAKAVQEAFRQFESCYRSSFSVDTDDANAPKNPANALSALIDYSERFKHDATEFDVEHTEITGKVPIGEDRHLVFKIDAVCRDKESQKCFVLEHKTSGTLASNWADQWILSIQVGTYIHALYCLMPPEQVYGAKVNGTFLRKKGNDFMRVPIKKTPEQMQQWLEDANFWYGEIERQFDELSNATPDDPVMLAFPRNTNACIDWGRVCPYHDFCVSWNNPLKRSDVVPGGFTIDHWDPMAEHLKTAKLIEVVEHSHD